MTRDWLPDLRALAVDLAARLDWRAEALALALIAAESALAYLYAGLLLPELEPPYRPFPGLFLFGLLALAYYLPHALDVLRVWSPRYETVLGVAIALSAVVTIKVGAFPHEPWLSTTWLGGTLDGLIIRPNPAVRPVWGVVGILVYAWWRGRSRAEPMLDSAYQMLRWGTLAATVALFLILMAAPDGGLIRERMSLAVVIYFAAALAGIGIARLRLEGVRSGNPLGPRWLASFAVPIAAVVLLAVVAAGLFSRRLVETLLVVLGPLIWLLSLAARALVLLVALLAFVLITPFLWLLERLGLDEFEIAGRAPSTFRSFDQFRTFADNTLDVADPLRYLIAGALLFLLGAALVRFVYRRRRHWRDTAVEERESVFSWDEATGSLGERLRRLVRRRRSRGDPLGRLRGDPRWAHTVAIRETYIRLLAWAARAGAARAPDQTPSEYAPAILASAPEEAEAIATITRLYNAARYRPEPASAAEAAAAREAWQRLARRRV